MQLIRQFMIASVSLALVACQQGTPGAASKDPAKDAAKAPDPGMETIATVDGHAVTRNLLESYVKTATGRAFSELQPEQKTEALDALVRAHVVAAQSQKDGLDKDKEVTSALELARLEVLQRAAQQKYLKDKTPTEQELRAEYETQISRMPRTEYRARHILVQTETFANELMARLKKGEKFDKLAAKDSMDATKERGGDLGWFTPQSMVKPFSDAVMALKKGETTAKPVQTQYGWHIIRLEDTREVEAPAFDSVKSQLGQMVYGKKFRAYQDELLKTAKVEKKL